MVHGTKILKEEPACRKEFECGQDPSVVLQHEEGGETWEKEEGFHQKMDE